MGLLRKTKELDLDRTYAAPIETVWRAWTQPEMLREWWGPDKTSVVECDMDLRVGGTIRVVTEAGQAMGKYAGTRWPMVGTFTHVEAPTALGYDARSWTEGEEEGTTIHHHNSLTLTATDEGTHAQLSVTITRIGAKAKMAAFGMKWGYKQQLEHLDRLLAGEVGSP